MKAEPEYLILMAFDTDKYQYVIPVYQRNYEWKKDNCLELFNDIVAAYDHDKTHFFGTFVQCIDSEPQANGVKTSIVIDGQQRLTTIYILLIALYDVAVSHNDDEAYRIHKLLFNESNIIDLPQDQQSRIKLKATKTDREQLTKLLEEKRDEMDRSSNIYINYNYFVELINKKLDEGYRISNIRNGLLKLEMVSISLKESDDDPQEIFDRINSTGVDLKLSDSIRNLLLMTNKNMDRLYEDYWLPMEETVGFEKLDDYLTNYLLYKLSDVNDKTAYNAFKKYVNDGNQTRDELINEICKYSKYYCAFVGRQNQYPEKIKMILSCFQKLKQTTIYPFLFNIFRDHEEQIINNDELEQILSFFLNYIVRRSAAEIPTNSLRGFFKTLYKRIFSNKENTTHENYVNSIYNFIASLQNTRDIMPNDELVKTSLVSTNKIYTKPDLAHVLLLTLEQNSGLKNELVQNNSDITIEHIMPQTLTEDWIHELGLNYAETYEKYLHVLGNLSLTGINSTLSNAPFDEKKKEYKKSRYTYLYSSVLDHDIWDGDAIVERGEILANRLLEIFKLPEQFTRQVEQQRVTIQRPNGKAETRSLQYDDYDYQNTRPVSYTLLGEEHPVESGFYIDAIISVLENINFLDPEGFADYCKNNPILSESGETPVFAYDPSMLREPKQIGNTGIYFETNNNSNVKMRLLRKILDAFGLIDDFTITIITK